MSSLPSGFISPIVASPPLLTGHKAAYLEAMAVWERSGFSYGPGRSQAAKRILMHFSSKFLTNHILLCSRPNYHYIFGGEKLLASLSAQTLGNTCPCP